MNLRTIYFPRLEALGFKDFTAVSHEVAHSKRERGFLAIKHLK